MVTKALLVRLEALPGKEAELADFLTGARPIVMEEPGTIAWFAIQFGPSTFGVYDVFPDDGARDAHLAGGVGQALGPNTGVLFSEPQIEKIDIIADKLRGNRLRTVADHRGGGAGAVGDVRLDCRAVGLPGQHRDGGRPRLPFRASASRAVPVALAGGAMGLINALGNLAGFVGPSVGGFL